ncbi:regulatory protein RecX [Granulicella sp. WH15]|uniref:regulatory protein RecX n=1 Tax=Granulicella sp. WH15 TaxID=2602070 RepID=UPI001366D39D|nr:regulatory protein RecX [Granulicella sp. WH15]QHN04929.1 regulatory protein RecX [Granulicella sp. WH15]
MAFQRSKPRDPVGEPGLFDYAIAALSRRMRTIRDLKRLMKPRAFPGEQGERDMDAVVARLIDLKYLSDTRFAADYTRLRKENQGFGRRRVQQDLTLKGIDKETVAATLAKAYDDADEVELARQYCLRKRIPQPTDQKETARTMNRLIRAGYSSTAIFKLLRGWNLPETAIIEEGSGDSDTYADD